MAGDAPCALVVDCIDQVWSLIDPKIAFRRCSITMIQDGCVYIDETCLKSRILSRKMDRSRPIFPYVVTLGNRLEEKIRATDDILEQYYLDTIANVALNTLLQTLETHLQVTYNLNCLSSMAPGSLEEWPVEEQAPLFTIIGDVETAIGVQLTEVFLMLPAKSESGVFFPTTEKFISCRICPRSDCDLRKAGYEGQSGND